MVKDQGVLLIIRRDADGEVLVGVVDKPEDIDTLIMIRFLDAHRREHRCAGTADACKDQIARAFVVGRCAYVASRP